MHQENGLEGLKCYIIAVVSDWQEWGLRLAAVGIDEISAADDLASGGLYGDAVKRAVRRSDFALVVLPRSARAEPDSSLLFEVGLVIGVGKPLVIVAPEGASVPPFLRQHALLLGEAASDPRLLSDAIARARRTRQRRGTQGNRPALDRNQVSMLLDRMGTAGLTAEQIVGLILQEAGLRPQAREHSGNRFSEGADVLVWDDALASIFGSPVLPVEVLIDAHALVLRLDQLLSVAKANEAPFVLVVFLRGDSQPQLHLSVTGPMLLAVSAEQLVEQLGTRSFAKALVALRNAALRASRSEPRGVSW